MSGSTNTRAFTQEPFAAPPPNRPSENLQRFSPPASSCPAWKLPQVRRSFISCTHKPCRLSTCEPSRSYILLVSSRLVVATLHTTKNFGVPLNALGSAAPAGACVKSTALYSLTTSNSLRKAHPSEHRENAVPP